MTDQSNPPNDLMTDTQLLPCPFCGGEGEFVLTYIDNNSLGFIQCKACGSAPFGTAQFPRASERWNTRAAIQAMSVVCRHEPYQGSCVHCDIPFRHGQPFYGEQAMSSSDVRREALEEAAGIAAAYPAGPPFGDSYEAGGMIRKGQNDAAEDIAQAIRALSSHTLEKRG